MKLYGSLLKNLIHDTFFIIGVSDRVRKNKRKAYVETQGNIYDKLSY
jgi:hypothetical protein